VQLADVLELAVRHGVGRFVEKRAGVMLPLAVGAMIPGIVHKAIDRAHSTEQQLNRAEYNPMKTAAANPWSAILGHMLGQGASATGQAIGGNIAHAGREMSGQGAEFGAGGASGLKGSFGQLGASPVTGVAQGISGGIGDLIKRKITGREFGEKKDPFSMGAGAAIQTFGKEMGTTGANLLRDMANKAMETASHAGDEAARQAILGELKKTDSVLANADDKTLMEAYHTMSRFAPVLSTDKNAVRSFLRQAVMSGSGPDYMSIKLLADSERAVTGGNDKRAMVLPPALAELLPSLGRGALMGGGVGAISGALADKDDRAGGAMRGALGGAAAGGLGGALHTHMNKAPEASTHQGYARGVVPNRQPREEWPLTALRDLHPYPAGNTGGDLKNLKYDGQVHSDNHRWVTPPVQDLARDLEKLQLPGGNS
jgi:hypothetical protein